MSRWIAPGTEDARVRWAEQVDAGRILSDSDMARPVINGQHTGGAFQQSRELANVCICDQSNLARNPLSDLLNQRALARATSQHYARRAWSCQRSKQGICA